MRLIFVLAQKSGIERPFMDLEPQQQVHHRVHKVKVSLAMYCFYHYSLRYRVWKVDVALSSIVEDEK